MSSAIWLSAVLIAPLAYIAGGFIAQHSETVLKTESHPLYTPRGVEIAWEQGFTSEELTEIFGLICLLCILSIFPVNQLTGISLKYLCIISIFLGLFFATITETTFVEEIQYDMEEHLIDSTIIFAVFWFPFLLMGCIKPKKSNARPHVD